jgi:hypothetical protein
MITKQVPDSREILEGILKGKKFYTLTGASKTLLFVHSCLLRYKGDCSIHQNQNCEIFRDDWFLLLSFVMTYNMTTARIDMTAPELLLPLGKNSSEF